MLRFYHRKKRKKINVCRYFFRFFIFILGKAVTPDYISR